MPDFLHERSDFVELLELVANQRVIQPELVEKDYWIMHSLWGLQAMKFKFEMKGGTSLSKGFGVIHRFSEDIDIRIEPPEDQEVKVGRNQNRPAHVESRRAYFDWLSNTISIPGIEVVERDADFDDEKMRGAGIRLHYPIRFGDQTSLKNGILLEPGFSGDTTPNCPLTISSWAYDAAVAAGVQIHDNRALDVLCYLPTYTFVEKLRAVSAKYRQLEADHAFPVNFTRHYYDIYCLLNVPEVQAFIDSPPEEKDKVQRFHGWNELFSTRNPALLLEDREDRERLAAEYRNKWRLYYNGQPDFDEVLARIRQYIDKKEIVQVRVLRDRMDVSQAPPTLNHRVEFSSYEAIGASPEAQAEFLSRVRAGFEAQAEPLSDYMQKHVWIGGEPFSKASHFRALELQSGGWDLSQASADVRKSLAENASALHLADPTFDVHTFIVGFQPMVGAFQEGGGSRARKASPEPPPSSGGVAGSPTDCDV